MTHNLYGEIESADVLRKIIGTDYLVNIMLPGFQDKYSYDSVYFSSLERARTIFKEAEEAMQEKFLPNYRLEKYNYGVLAHLSYYAIYQKVAHFERIYWFSLPVVRNELMQIKLKNTNHFIQYIDLTVEENFFIQRCKMQLKDVRNIALSYMLVPPLDESNL